MEKLLDYVAGMAIAEKPLAIATFGKKHYPALQQDYERNLAFSLEDPLAVKSIKDEKAKGFLESYPGGYGIRFQNANETSVFGQFVFAVISKAVADNESKLRGDDALDYMNPDHADEIIEIERRSKMLRQIKTDITSMLSVPGNDLRSYFKSREKFVRILGDNEGNVKMWVSAKPITIDNGGEYLGEFPNSCDAEVDVSGQIRGLQGAVGAIASSHYAYFHVEDDDLFIWESWFSGGKEKFHENEHGRLIK